MIQFRRGTASAASTANEVLAAGQPFVETDTSKLKIGDGSTAFNDLPYIGGGSGGKRYFFVTVGSSYNGYTADDVDYLCDGVDDQVEINQALAYQGPSSNTVSRGIVHLLPGRYNISDSIVFDSNGAAILEGENTEYTDDDETRLYYYGSVAARTAVIQMETGKSCRNLTLTNLGYTATSPVGIEGAQYCTITNVSISGGNPAVNLSGSAASVMNCNITNCYKAINASGTQNRIEHSVFTGSRYNNNVIDVTGSMVEIKNNYFLCNSSNCLISMQLPSNGRSGGCITNNNFNGTCEYCVLLLTGVNGVVISGNYNSITTAFPRTMFSLSGCYNVTCVGNSANRVSQAVFNLAGCYGCTIVGNSANLMSNALFTMSNTGANQCTIIGNSILSTTAPSLHLYLSNQNTIVGNVIRGSTASQDSAIYTEGGSGNVIESNVITSTAYD